MENETITTARRILIYVAYDGTFYHGFQVQPGVPTIEGVLNETLSSLFKEDIAVIGASRTDAGVHSRGNIAVFDKSSTDSFINRSWRFSSLSTKSAISRKEALSPLYSQSDTKSKQKA